MKNKERQKQLDEQKWLASEAKQEDQSGKMDYCKYCKENYQICGIDQARKEQNSSCATAYNRMIRSKKNDKQRKTTKH